MTERCAWCRRTGHTEDACSSKRDAGAPSGVIEMTTDKMQEYVRLWQLEQAEKLTDNVRRAVLELQERLDGALRRIEALELEVARLKGPHHHPELLAPIHLGASDESDPVDPHE